MVIHGFRSLFCTVLNESNLFNHVIIERQLAHVPQNRIRSAYNRAQYLEEAVRLMGWYGIKVSARTLYLCRRKIIGFYNFIRLSVESIEEVNVGFVAPDLANIFYFDPVMSEKVSSLLNELVTQFKK